MHDWTAKEIRVYAEKHPKVSVKDLARMAGRTVSEIKYILKGHSETWVNNLL